MSEKRYVVSPNKVNSWCVVDVPANCVELILDKVNAQLAVNLLNKRADELREMQAEAAVMQAEFKRFLEGVCYWRRVHIGHAMMRAEPTLEDEELERYRNLVHSTTAGADLLAELEQLQGYRAFVHSCIKSGEVCVYTFEEYLEKMKNE